MFRGGLEPWHIIIILVILLLLFGGKKMPDAARSIGRSLRILKAETKGLRDEHDDEQPGRADPSAASADIPRPLPEGRVAEPRDVPTPTPAAQPRSQPTAEPTGHSDALHDQR